jgi:hypothetical protein
MKGLTYNDLYVNLQDDLSVSPSEVEKALVQVWAVENAVGQDMNAKNDQLPKSEMNTGSWYYEQLPEGPVKLEGQSHLYFLHKEGTGILVKIKDKNLLNSVKK